jgi:SagB-type dehydrogenase family enzyme
MAHPLDPAATFHEQTKMLLGNDGEKLLPRLAPNTVVDRFPLPHVAISPRPSLEQAIISRRTSRSFDPVAPLPLEMLARFLAFSCGRIAPMMMGGLLSPAYHRAVPSAGARYPVEVCLVASRVIAIPAGAYAYDSERHLLELVRPGFFAEAVADWALNQPWIARASVVFVLVGDPARIQERYAARGYRYMLFEAGHIAQNLYLLGAAYGVCVQATGGFMDDALSSLLALDDTGRQVLYLTAAGLPSPDRGLAPW